MLILSRTAGEKIFIGHHQEICVEVRRIKGSQVKIAITADKSIPVWREEVLSSSTDEKLITLENAEAV